MTDKTTFSSSKSYFDSLGEGWKDLQENYFNEQIREAVTKKIAEIKTAVDIAVDLGTGNGYMIFGLAPVASKVFGIDQSKEMLKGASKFLSEQKVENYELRQGSDRSVPLDDNLADVVTANMYLHHCHGPLVAIKEAFRILKPGGLIIISDMEGHNDEALAKEMHDVWLGFKKASIHQWFEQAGFENIDSERIEHCSCSACSETEKNSLTVPVFLASGMKPSL